MNICRVVDLFPPINKIEIFYIWGVVWNEVILKMEKILIFMEECPLTHPHAPFLPPHPQF